MTLSTLLRYKSSRHKRSRLIPSDTSNTPSQVYKHSRLIPSDTSNTPSQVYKFSHYVVWKLKISGNQPKVSCYLQNNGQLFWRTAFLTAIWQPDLERCQLFSEKRAVFKRGVVLDNSRQLSKTMIKCQIPRLPSNNNTTLSIINSLFLHRSFLLVSITII